MSQVSLIIDDQQGGDAYTTDLNNALAALASSQSGTSAPGSPSQGMTWADTSVTNQITYKMYDGAAWRSLCVINTSTGVVTFTIQASQVLTANINDAAVTAAKLAASAVTNTKLNDGSVTWEKLSASVKFDEDDMASNSATGFATQQSTKAYVDTAVAAQNEIKLCDFDGSIGTPVLDHAVGISSVTDNGAGDYTVNFATPFPDANYACVWHGAFPHDNAYASGFNKTDQQAGSCRARYRYNTGSFDVSHVSVIAMRGNN